jgi:hypothetical protein
VRTTSRRRLDAALLAGGSVLVGAAALVGGAVGDTERIARYWAVADVADDGAAQVTEVIDYDFGGVPVDRHGIERRIPGLDTSTRVDVSSPDAPADTEITPTVDGINIRIGDPQITVSGRHRYEIDYDLPGVEQGGTVDWEAVGTEWDVGIEQAEVHLVTPFELDDAGCFVGAAGSDTACDLRTVEPGHVVATVDDLDSGEGVSIEGQVGATLDAAPAAPAPPTDAPAEPGTGLLPPAGAAAAAAALAAVPATLAVRRAGRERVSPGGAADAAYGGPPLGGAAPWPTAPPVPPGSPVPGAARAPGFAPIERGGEWGDDAADAPGPVGGVVAAPPAPTTVPAPPEPERRARITAGIDPVSEIRVDAAELADMATIEFAPPAGVSPAHGGIVLREEVRDEHKVAWLIQAAIDGVIELDDSDGTRISRLDGGRPSAEEAAVVDRMFRSQDTIELGSYDRDFASGWRELSHRLSDWRRTSGLWDAAADGRRLVTRVLGVLAALAGGVLAAAGGAFAGRLGAGWLALAAVGGILAGAGLAAALGAWELHVRTAAGSALWLRVESFRRFLAESEGYHADEAAKRGVLREYTAWAVAVGEIDRWSRAVNASSIAPEVAGVGYAYMAPLLLASTTTTATAPSSSGGGGGFGGGFGGGSVGGGAGGGGGGSW